MEGNEQLSIIIPMLKDVAHGIDDDQWGNSTPCASFDVGAVMDHMSGLASSFAPAFRGDAPPEADGAPLDPAERSAAFQSAMDALLDAVGSTGALDRTITTPSGPIPGAVFARLVAFDGLVHGYDLASSTGQQWEPPADLVGEIDEFARQAFTPDMRDGETFAAEQPAPDDASAMLRLVAFSGRSVAN